VPSAVAEVDMGRVARFSVRVKGGLTSVPLSVEVLLVADVTRMVELRVREGATLALTPMLEAVLAMDIRRVAGFWMKKVEAIMVVVGVLRV
jgi:hypothetical protein